MNHLTIIKCGKLYDGIHDKLEPSMEIAVEGNRITAVGRGLPRPENCTEIDLSDATVTPGMIDAHVHFNIFDWHDRADENLFASPASRGMAGLYCAHKSLRRGFTTVRHLGTIADDGYSCLDAKRLIEAGYFEGSRMVVAPHFLGTTGSHGDSTQRLIANPALAQMVWSQYPGYGSGPDSFREIVRQQVKMGADLIKMMATGGFASLNDGPDDIQLSDDEMVAIIDTAHLLNRKVTAHAYNNQLVRKLVEFGIDGIEHAALMDDPSVAELMEKKGTRLVPTFCPYEEIVNLDEENLMKKPKAFREKLLKYADRLRRARQVILDSHLDLGYGTDLVAVHQPYENGYEYEAWMKSGVNPFRALRAATSNNAKILDRPEIGSVEVGKLADLAAWKRDLLTDPKALLDCAFVMKDGVVYPTETVE